MQNIFAWRKNQEFLSLKVLFAVDFYVLLFLHTSVCMPAAGFDAVKNDTDANTKFR
jgi:hypothetical protein